MQIIFKLAMLLTTATFTATAQSRIVTLTADIGEEAVLKISTNQVATLLFFRGDFKYTETASGSNQPNRPSAKYSFRSLQLTIEKEGGRTGGWLITSDPAIPPNLVLVGPWTVRIKGDAIATFRLEPAITTASAPLVMLSPQSNNTIAIESSPNLIDWAEINRFSVESESKEIFYRLRILE